MVRASFRTGTSGIVVVVFDHVTIRVADRGASERFYDTVLGTLGIGRHATGDEFTEWGGQFSLAAADAGHPITRGLHIAWAAPSREHVHAFWQAGVDAGFRDDGAPGPRAQYGPDYYGGFLLDPDGNSAEAVHFDGQDRPLGIDHVWIRVADTAAARSFYATIAPHAGLRLGADTPERVQFRGDVGSFSLIADGRRRTEHLHLAFAARDDAAVDAFHAAATAAGHRDNGPPGQRTSYHRGYYSAYALDPEGANIELVNHNR
jgi:catechol 2,3-dioxygenase-like lactoylglutathione lyase family enzyme